MIRYYYSMADKGVCCFECGKLHASGVIGDRKSGLRMRASAKQDGWVVTKTKALCPKHG